MSYTDTFADRISIVLDEIEADESGVDVPETIEFAPRDNPDINVDGSARYAKHNIIGGDVVRQKIGEDPLNISVRGVCDEETAQQIDTLRHSKRARLISDRISTDVQVGSISTQPYETGGAVDMDSGDYLYNYTLNLIGA